MHEVVRVCPLVPQDLQYLVPDLCLPYQLVHPIDDSVAAHAIIVRPLYHKLLPIVADLRIEGLGEGPRRFQMHRVEILHLAAGSIDFFLGRPGRQRHAD